MSLKERRGVGFMYIKSHEHMSHEVLSLDGITKVEDQA